MQPEQADGIGQSGRGKRSGQLLPGKIAIEGAPEQAGEPFQQPQCVMCIDSTS